MSGSDQRITITSASSDVRTYTKLDFPAGYPDGRGEKLVKVCVASYDPFGVEMLKIRFVLVDIENSASGSQVVLAAQECSCTEYENPLRSGTDGVSGNYVGKVMFNESGNSLFDAAGRVGKAEWRVGIPSFGGMAPTAVVVDLFFVSAN